MELPADRKAALRWTKYVLDFVVCGAFVYLLYSFFFYKVDYVDRVYGRVVGCNDCFREAVVAHDGAMLGLAALVFFLSLWARYYLLGVVLRLLALVIATAFIADVIIFENFTVRLNPSDFFVYGDQFSLVWDHLNNTVDNFQVTFYLAVAGILLALFFPSGRGRKPWMLSLSLLPLLAFTAYAHVKEPDSYVHDWAMRNVVANMFSNGVTVDFSDSFKAELATGPDPLDFGLGQCAIATRADNPDVVILILESWSAWQSALWGDVGNDWTPRLDQLARENVWFDNMYATGFSTNEGLMGMLNGTPFFSPIKSYLSIGLPFEAHWDWDDTLPTIFNDAGYHTAFLTTGDLSFSLKGDWLDNLGYDFREGHDYPGYEGLPRSHFRSVPDDALYKRTLEYYRTRKAESEAPVMLTVESVSTHHAYIHPYTRERKAEPVFRYMDDTAYEFYEMLRDEGFFGDGGILLVLSDHRSMTPITPAEIEAFGQRAASRIPAFMVAEGLEPTRVDALAHHADILPSFAASLAANDCIDTDYTNLFEPDHERQQCLLHARGDNRDFIDVFCPAGEGRVRLNGDATAFIEADGIPPAQQSALVERINRTRLEFQQRYADYRQRRQ